MMKTSKISMMGTEKWARKSLSFLIPEEDGTCLATETLFMPVPSIHHCGSFRRCGELQSITNWDSLIILWPCLSAHLPLPSVSQSVFKRFAAGCLCAGLWLAWLINLLLLFFQTSCIEYESDPLQDFTLIRYEMRQYLNTVVVRMKDGLNVRLPFFHSELAEAITQKRMLHFCCWYSLLGF